MSRTATRDVHGILLLDKARGPSSNRALQQVRQLFGATRAGHTGSLDPLASGLLPICLGEATKIAGLLLGARKAYAAEIRLGLTTTTDDAEGDGLVERAVPALQLDAVRATAATFVGRIRQVPPVYAAIKRGGVPLYRRARRGEAVAAPPREVEIHALQIDACDGGRITLQVECGSGTYIRSLARDLGERLGCGGHLTALRRLWVAPFRTPAMRTFDELVGLRERAGETGLDACLLPLEAGLADWPRVVLGAAEAIALGNGLRVTAPSGLRPGPCLALEAGGRPLALAEVDADGRLHTRRGFHWSA
ncbi:MAG: tRNA pseudouridine(55) synthase TruB [Xanthomonadaceae bacterium]|nr:tRNA pseudouridine(55) synthase TruB [Xanthomonadaceae bacterium]